MGTKNTTKGAPRKSRTSSKKTAQQLEASSKNLDAPVYYNNYHRELADLKVQDHELDAFAYYFGVTFDRETEPMTVLVELLERIKGVATRSDSVDLEGVIDKIQDRLFSQCGAGDRAASDFVNGAGQNTATIFERVLERKRADDMTP